MKDPNTRVTMERYRNAAKNAGVTHYEIGPECIDLRFKDGTTYRYDFNKPGPAHVEEMKDLAQRGSGLTTYVNKNVRGNFAMRLRDGNAETDEVRR